MEDDLLPMHEDEPAGDFDIVLRGYDRLQVNDHLARFEAALGEAHDRAAEDATRIAALERQVTEQHERLVDAERRAAGRPEPVPVAGDRIAAMLRLADEEATALRDAARQEAERVIGAAQQQATQESAKRSAELDRRERDIASAAEESDAMRRQA